MSKKKKEAKEKIDYSAIIKKHPWIVEKDQKCVLSPDADGLLSGLLMSDFLNWEVVGFYNGKVLLLKNGMSAEECVFLDIEILRPEIRSVGHHVNLHNLNAPPEQYEEDMGNCINPNHIRSFDRCHNFSQKYPLGNVHLLLYILEEKYPGEISLNKDGLGAIFFADGVWKILFKYTNNIIDWFEYLHTDKESVWWKHLKNMSVITLIQEIDNLLIKIKKSHADQKQTFGHFEIDGENVDLDSLESMLRVFEKETGWNYKDENWKLEDLNRYNFTKKIFEGSKSNESFLDIYNQRPLSLAMTGGTQIQYTLEEPDQLL